MIKITLERLSFRQREYLRKLSDGWGGVFGSTNPTMCALERRELAAYRSAGRWEITATGRALLTSTEGK